MRVRGFCHSGFSGIYGSVPRFLTTHSFTGTQSVFVTGSEIPVTTGLEAISNHKKISITSISDSLFTFQKLGLGFSISPRILIEMLKIQYFVLNIVS